MDICSLWLSVCCAPVLIATTSKWGRKRAQQRKSKRAPPKPTPKDPRFFCGLFSFAGSPRELCLSASFEADDSWRRMPRPRSAERSRHCLVRVARAPATSQDQSRSVYGPPDIVHQRNTRSYRGLYRRRRPRAGAFGQAPLCLGRDRCLLQFAALKVRKCGA